MASTKIHLYCALNIGKMDPIDADIDKEAVEIEQHPLNKAITRRSYFGLVDWAPYEALSQQLSVQSRQLIEEVNLAQGEQAQAQAMQAFRVHDVQRSEKLKAEWKECDVKAWQAFEAHRDYANKKLEWSWKNAKEWTTLVELNHRYVTHRLPYSPFYFSPIVEEAKKIEDSLVRLSEYGILTVASCPASFDQIEEDSEVDEEDPDAEEDSSSVHSDYDAHPIDDTQVSQPSTHAIVKEELTRTNWQAALADTHQSPDHDSDETDCDKVLTQRYICRRQTPWVQFLIPTAHPRFPDLDRVTVLLDRLAARHDIWINADFYYDLPRANTPSPWQSHTEYDAVWGFQRGQCLNLLYDQDTYLFKEKDRPKWRGRDSSHRAGTAGMQGQILPVSPCEAHIPGSVAADPIRVVVCSSTYPTCEDDDFNVQEAVEEELVALGWEVSGKK